MYQRKKEFLEIKEQLRKGISVKDTYEEETIGTCEVGYTEKEMICVATYFTTAGKLLEKQITITKEKPYYPEPTSSFKEAPIMIETIKKLTEMPSVILILNNTTKNNTLSNASHVGVQLNCATIGITTKGTEEKQIQTKKFANPLSISLGHNISQETAERIIKKQLQGHKLPEPLHMTHKILNKVRKGRRIE